MILVAPPGFENDLAQEITKSPRANLLQRRGRLFEVESSQADWVWAQNIWLEPEVIAFDSISRAAAELKKRNKMWALHSVAHHRRAQLIQEKLANVSGKPIQFLHKLNFPALGAWTLLDPQTMMASRRTTSPFPDGEFEFQEDKLNAPSRAYLKLWEFFTLTGHHPKKGETCVDLGSSPGGWTWVLAQLGCSVLSVDKADLDPRLVGLSAVKAIKADAFTLKPEDMGPVDWLFSDLICYPPKLFELVGKWQTSGLVKNFVCTIKFQGSTDFETLAKFQGLKGSKIRHLHHNKHEVTWFYIQSP